MAFSSCSKYILVQTGPPNWTLYYWSWERAKLMASMKTISHFSPNSIPVNTDIALSPSMGGPISNASNIFAPNTFQITQVSFNPNDNSQVCVIGNDVFKLLKYQEGVLKFLQIPKIDTRVINFSHKENI